MTSYVQPRSKKMKNFINESESRRDLLVSMGPTD